MWVVKFNVRKTIPRNRLHKSCWNQRKSRVCMVIPGWSWLVSKRSAINKFIIQQSVNQWQRFYFISFVICRFYLDCLPILSIFSSCTQLRMFTFLKLLLAYPFLVQWRILRCKRTLNQQHLSEGKKVLWKHTQRDMQTVQIIFDSLSSNGMINTICERWKSKRTKKFKFKHDETIEQQHKFSAVKFSISFEYQI